MTRRLIRSMSATSFAASSAVMSRSWWLCTSMNGYFAFCGWCSGTTSVDFGSYSSIDIVWASAAAGHSAAASRSRRRLRVMPGSFRIGDEH